MQISLFYEGSKEMLGMILHYGVSVGCKKIRIFHFTMSIKAFSFFNQDHIIL